MVTRAKAKQNEDPIAFYLSLPSVVREQIDGIENLKSHVHRAYNAGHIDNETWSEVQTILSKRRQYLEETNA